ncbi:MAG TPA: helix-turn-helix transcriptional regulator, partial [Chitinophagaceae bacterium]
MRKKSNAPFIVNSISELHRMLSLPKPEHPLVSVINLKDIIPSGKNSLVFNFYSVWLEKNVESKIRYGQNYFDFDEGSMIFLSPGQVVSTGNHKQTEFGWGLVFHPDFIKNYSLAKIIKNYGFFSYAVNEALHLSEKEEAMITSIMQNILKEYHSIIDHFSQDVMISQIELLLNYCNRFYNRQFITRKTVNNDLLSRMEALLTEYFGSNKLAESGIPTVQYISSQLNISPNYLSDMLRSLTGQNTQQHIHNKLIEKAKEILSTTTLSVSEIAYELGFEYPQSFNKIFKTKT